MAKAVIMLAMIKQILNTQRMENDCLRFDEKESVKAGRRIRQGLRKIEKMSKKMREDMLVTQFYINKKRGDPKLEGKEEYYSMKEHGKRVKPHLYVKR